jgi:hypothetical protein
VARVARTCLLYQTRCVQPFPFSTLLPCALRVLLGCEFLLLNPFFHDWHCVFDQCDDVVAIAGTLMLPTAMVAATATVATRLVGIMLPPWLREKLRP